MSENNRIRTFQTELDMIAEEASARNELAGGHVIDSLTATQEEVDRQAHALDESLRATSESRDQSDDDSGRRLAGGETLPDAGHAFGFEDDDDFREEVRDPSAPRVQPRGSRSRHRRPPAQDLEDDEDFSKTNWLE